MYGWIVYNKEDTPDCGWVVENEQEAKRQCAEDENLDYCFCDCPYAWEY